MIDERYIELINGEIDGVNSPEESAELRKHLDTNAEARRYYNELCQLAEMFDQAKELEPPRELRERILLSISTGERDTEKPGFIGTIITPFRNKPRRKLAFAFCAGAVIGICLFFIITRITPIGMPEDFEGLTGTLRIDPGGRVLITEPVDFDLNEVTGHARISYTDKRILAELELSSKSEIEVIFHYEKDIHLEGLSVSGPGSHATETKAEETRLLHNGDRGYVFVFRNYMSAKPPINIRILAGGDQLFEETVQPGRK